MANFRIVISDKKSGKSVQKEINVEEAQSLIGRKIGDAFHGESIGLTGYEFSITGGTDIAGFPMRKDVEGSGRRKILTRKSIGVREAEKGQRLRKTVAGNTIHEATAQINVVITKQGSESLFEKKEESKEQEE